LRTRSFPPNPQGGTEDTEFHPKPQGGTEDTEFSPKPQGGTEDAEAKIVNGQTEKQYRNTKDPPRRAKLIPWMDLRGAIHLQTRKENYTCQVLQSFA